MRKNKHMQHSPETVAKALELRRLGYTYKQIAEAVGASSHTIMFWCSPRQEELRQRERERKKKYTTPCIDCGGPTGYGGKISSRCQRCRTIFNHENKRWTKESIIAAIQRWNDEYGAPPKATDWNATISKNRGKKQRDKSIYPSGNSVYGPHAPFDSWADAIEAAGFPRPKRRSRGNPHKKYWTEERIIQALQAHARNGYGPMMLDWQRTAEDHPTGGWVSTTFGSWSKALEAAGLEPDPRSKGGGRSREAQRPVPTPILTKERADFIKRCMERKVLKQYITRLMWKQWGYPNERSLKKALIKEGIVEELGWQYRFNRQLTQEEIEEGLSL